MKIKPEKLGRKTKNCVESISDHLFFDFCN